MIFVNHFSPIRSLANDIDTPILWTPEQRKWLEGSSMSTLVAMLDRQNETDWVTLIQPVLSQYGPVGEALLWTLEKGTGAHYTPEVADAWLEVYSTVLSGACEQNEIHMSVTLTHTRAWQYT